MEFICIRFCIGISLNILYLQVLENEIFKFEEQICDFEEDLNNGLNIPEDVQNTILTVVGMAKLLMAQKLSQLRGLCDKNIVSLKFFNQQNCNRKHNIGCEPPHSLLKEWYLPRIDRLKIGYISFYKIFWVLLSLFFK